MLNFIHEVIECESLHRIRSTVVRQNIWLFLWSLNSSNGVVINEVQLNEECDRYNR